MKQESLAFLSAVQFLTRLPIPDPGWEEGRLDRAAKWFPLVGALVGGILALILWLSLTVWSDARIAVAITLVAGVLVTGALHEDGLADSADGLGGGRDTGHRLAIMKDSSIGAYGALALMLAMLLRFATLTALSVRPDVAITCVIAAQTAGRAAMLPIIWTLPYARAPEDAKVAPLTGKATPRGSATAGLITVAACLPLLLIDGTAMLGLAAAVLLCILMWHLLKSKLGGWTGDTAGATQIICEIGFLLGVCAWI